MKILSVTASNFGSYKTLNFDFQNKGLSLIHGPTGSGKSTICDLVPWVLFGVTSKDGSVDEIRNWQAEGPTDGEVYLKANNNTYTIKRSRKPNDLYIFAPGMDTPQRGKDLNDTQKLINNLLGMTSETYLASAYFHEFSQTAQFFSTTAKNRRLICEQIADLGMAKKLQSSLGDKKKAVKSEVDKLVRREELSVNSVNHLSDQCQDLNDKVDNWKPKEYTSDELELMSWEKDIVDSIYKFLSHVKTVKVEIAKLKNEKCITCGAPKASEAIFALQHSVESTQDSLNKAQNNLDKIHDLKNITTKNPYISMLDKVIGRLEHEQAIYTGITNDLAIAKLALADLELLSETIDTFRAQIISTNVSRLQNSTNDLLNSIFDAEINVTFSATSNDKLEVEIQKDGNLASYTQLSKGQRCMLKLAFGVAIMRQVAEQSGQTPNCVFFDEALDGLSEQLKIKSLALFRKLAVDYESVFVVEHSEGVKGMIENKIEVTMTPEGSKIETP